jgi:hypothetical protein
MANTTKATELSQLSSALQVDESTGEIIFTGSLSVDSNTLFIDSDNNRVGIGTLTPSTALDVAGDLSVTGTVDGRNVSSDGSKLDTIETSAKDDQTISAGSGLSGGGTGDVTLDHADTSSQGSVNNSGGTVIQDVSVDSFGHVTSLGSKSLDAADVGALGVNDKAADSDQLDGLNSTQFLRSDTSDTLNGDLTVSGDLNVDSGTLFVDSANNRVGVGTTNPDNGDLSTHDPIIHVKGPENAGDYRLVARFESGDDVDNTGASILINHENDRGLLVEAGRAVGNSAVANFNIVNNVGDATKAITIEEGGDISFYEDTGTTPKFFWDASAERLGIGTSSPDATCSIHQDQNDTTSGTFDGPHLKLRALDTTDNTGFTGVSYSSSSLDNYGWTAGALRESVGGRSNFIFRSHRNDVVGAERMRIDSFGNVGIGNSFPSSFDDFANDLAVGKGTGRAGITIYGDQSSSLSFADGTSGDERYAGYITYAHMADELRFYANYSLNTSPAAVITSERDFQFNSGFGSAATAYGCRAWVNFDGTGTVSIKGSGNVSSITDNGTGYYDINFTTNMPDNDYSAVVGGMRSSTTFHGHGVITVRETFPNTTRLYSYDDVLGSGVGNLDLERVTYAAFR